MAAKLPVRRCALTAPFHPCHARLHAVRRFLSVALSLGLPPAAVSSYRSLVKPGLSSPQGLPPRSAAVWFTRSISIAGGGGGGQAFSAGCAAKKIDILLKKPLIIWAFCIIIKNRDRENNQHKPCGGMGAGCLVSQWKCCFGLFLGFYEHFRKQGGGGMWPSR